MTDTESPARMKTTFGSALILMRKHVALKQEPLVSDMQMDRVAPQKFAGAGDPLLPAAVQARDSRLCTQDSFTTRALAARN